MKTYGEYIKEYSPAVQAGYAFFKRNPEASLSYTH
jgi:hypothetical protein